MFSKRICFFFWLSPTLIFWERGVQGLFNMKSLGEEGEHLSHDSASWNSRDISNPQQNIHVEDGSRMVPSSFPVSGDFSNQTPEQYVNWGDEISPVDVWYNHPDSAPNIEEAMNYRPQNTWNYETVEHSSFSGHNHQAVSYQHVGSSQDQASSSSNILPVYNGDFHYGNNVKFEPHSNEWHPVPSYLPQAHQYVEIPYEGQMTENPAFHSAQNDFSFAHHSEIRNRFNQNFYREALNLSPASSSHNSGLNSGAGTDHKINSIESKNSVFVTNPKGKDASANIGADKNHKEMLKLIKVLAKEFSACEKETARKHAAYSTQGVGESENSQREKKLNEEYIDKQISTILRIGKQTEGEIASTLTSAIFRRKILTSTENVSRIQWSTHSAMKKEICLFAKKFNFNNEEEKKKYTTDHMENISIMGITFMKIISKKYPKDKVSEEFEKEESLINYTKKFWAYCFSDNEGKEEALEEFFMSIREGTSKDYVKIVMQSEFLMEDIKPDQIISFIRKKITSRTYREQVYLFAWHFSYIRTVFYYPELLSNIKNNPENLLRKFIDSGILYFLRLHDLNSKHLIES
ncbi:expressed protein [Phakopsora pachyrhizi]|uniref:Expressed protein n=1 Tax=Phakopsora pachyrhizi TaxID=170000 RepID=A0AAV0BII8_PHAPC|nr:expressed protein [Phakopsora pachyrhizi]